MRKRELSKLIAGLARLTPQQRRRVAAELSASEGNASTVAVIEHGVAEEPCCPHCAGKTVVRNGTAHGLQRFKCRDCAKTFNALTGTPLARLRMKGKWVAQAEALRDGLSLKQVEERLNVSHGTAFRWRHRFLALPKTVQARALVGIVETDETYFLESRKGSKSLPRIGRKRGGKARKPGTSKEQIPVLVSRDRAGATADCVLNADDARHVIAALKPIIGKDAILCTDGSRVLAAAARGLGVAHRPVNLSAGIRIVGGVYHVQNVNSYDSRLKGWMQRFHGVATRYLDSYLGWFRTLDRSPHSAPNPLALLALAAGLNQVTI